MIQRKKWADYTPAEIENMKTAVMYASDDTPFSQEYAAAYLGKSSSTLQYWRSHKTDMLRYSKIGGGIVYLKRHLKEFIEQNQRLSTAA